MEWQHFVHVLDFVVTFVNFGKDPTMVITIHVKLFFAKWQRDIGIRCKSNSTSKHIPMAIGSTHKRRFVGLFSIWKNCSRFYVNELKRTSNSMINLCTRQHEIVYSTRLPYICFNSSKG
jgi:hypothetical protein